MARLLLILFAIMGFSMNACLQPDTKNSKDRQLSSAERWFVDEKGDTIRILQKTDAEWKALLDPGAYHVLREKGTELAFTGKYHDTHENGMYSCAGCGLPLFSSDTKFDSGTGWPSFFAPVDKTHVRDVMDGSYGMRRTEVVCNRCSGHLGHVFDDGPKPTGLRYCMNSVSLSFLEK